MIGPHYFDIKSIGVIFVQSFAEKKISSSVMEFIFVLHQLKPYLNFKNTVHYN